MMEKPLTGLKKSKTLQQQKKPDPTTFFASVNSAHYNMSIEYDKDGTTVEKFSIGYTLKEPSVNYTMDKDSMLAKKSKTSTISRYSIYYNFTNVNRIKDFSNLSAIPPYIKFALYKNVQVIFYGVLHTNTNRINLKASKAIEILLLVKNIYAQIKENEGRLEQLKKNKKQYPNDKNLSQMIDAETEQKEKLKIEFMDMIRNILKKYF